MSEQAPRGRLECEARENHVAHLVGTRCELSKDDDYIGISHGCPSSFNVPVVVQLLCHGDRITELTVVSGQGRRRALEPRQ